MVKNKPSWRDVKVKLGDWESADLLALLKDLYTANKDNQLFLNTRFGLGNDGLEPYKKVITRWIWPDISIYQYISISKAKKAISDYKKAEGNPERLVELMVFYCEQATGFSDEVGLQDAGYYAALVHMFDNALKLIETLKEKQRQPYWDRLDVVCLGCRHFGYGVIEEMNELFAQYGVEI